jgi:hypothetical protein
MKNIGLIIALLGLISSALYATGVFSGFKKVSEPVKVHSKKIRTNKRKRNTVGRSHAYGGTEVEY